MATSGDSSPLNQLLGRIMQTIRSVQRSVDGGVDSNILQRNISIIEGFHPCLGLFTWRGGLERHAQIQGNMY